MSLVVAQMSSPALPVVALLGMPMDDYARECVEGLATVWESAAWPHIFVGPGSEGPTVCFLTMHLHIQK